MTRRGRARDLYKRGRLLDAARREADACDRDGYDITAAILRDLTDEVETLRSALVLIRDELVPYPYSPQHLKEIARGALTTAHARRQAVCAPDRRPA